jgi:uncharacterized protein (TIGR03437 family)
MLSQTASRRIRHASISTLAAVSLLLLPGVDGTRRRDASPWTAPALASSRQAAQTLSCGALVAGAISAAGEVDQFTFNGQANEKKMLTLAESGFPAGVSATATVFSPTAVVVVTFSANGQRLLTLPETGAYVVQVRASNFASTGSYGIGLECSLPTSPVDQALVCGSLFAGSINALAKVDQFTFAGQANQQVTLTLAESGFPAGVSATATVFSPTAVVVITFSANGQRLLTLPETGAYVVQVRASNFASAGAYSLGLECLLPTSPVDAMLFCGVVLSGRRINASAQVDQISFIGQANQQATLTLAESGFPAGVSATATVFSPAAAVVVTFSANSQQQLTLAESGTYLIQVRASNFASTGSYSLGLQCLPALVNAASYSAIELASESIATVFGVQLATGTAAAGTLPLPTTLAGSTMKVRDSLGVTRDAPLFFASPNQMNFQVPPGAMNGIATMTITSGNGSVSIGATQIVRVAPGLFAANANGQGVAAGVALRVRANGQQVFEPIARFDQAQGRFVAVPIDLGPATDQVFLILFGTGVRFRSSLSAVTATIGGANAEVLHAGAQGDFVGLDQINLRVARTLAGRGEVDATLAVDGKAANPVRVSFR